MGQGKLLGKESQARADGAVDDYEMSECLRVRGGRETGFEAAILDKLVDEVFLKGHLSRDLNEVRELHRFSRQ